MTSVFLIEVGPLFGGHPSFHSITTNLANQKAGYAKSEWLSKFAALDPFADPVPEHQRQIGVAKINTPVLASVDGYSGNILSPGDIIAVRSFASEHALVNVMREVTRLPKDSLSYETFVPWQNALPGDLLSGLQPSSMKKPADGLRQTALSI
ncbi:MAG: hypothetical protein PHI98_03675 [Eubacteriales bacterium]|nr:hypothetical protein [Eubacteriales bacterium]